MGESLLISTSDIAELVDERLPVVSTWRNRFKDGPNAFPKPAGGTPARPLFDFESVRDWITSNRPEKDLHTDLLRIRVWSAIRSLSGGIDQFNLVYWLHQQLHLRKAELGGTDPRNAATATGADEYTRKLFGTERPVAIDTIKSLIQMASANDLIEVSDFALARLSAGYGRSGGDIGAVGSNVSAILAAAALAFITDVKPAPIIYDPACGIGETLIETFKAFERIGRRGMVIGTEINARVATLASIRLGLRDIPATIQTGDTLSTRQFQDERPDLIVAEPPLGLHWVGVWSPDDPRSRFGVPPTRNADLAWVVDAASRLEGAAGALVLTSMGALGKGGAEERVRANLVRSGTVKAIIALPPNLLQYSSMALALWVLRAPSEDSGLVHLVDASSPELGDSGPAQRTDWIRSNISSWVINPLGADPLEGVATATVHLDDLLSVGMDLTPTRWTAQPEYSGVVEALFQENNLLAYELRDFKPIAPDFYEIPPAPHVVTIREITEFPDSREAKLWTGRGVPNDEAPDEAITSRDISSGVLRAGRSNRGTESGFWTAPGDIVFTTMTRVKAVVDTEGGHRIGNGVHALRLDQSSRFDPHYVALCLAARWNERYQKGATIKHAKPGDLEIPLLPLDAQLEWIAAFRDLERVKSEARNIVELAEDLEGTAQNALRFGHPDGK